MSRSKVRLFDAKGFVSTSAALTLAACGGGSNGSVPPPPPTPTGTVSHSMTMDLYPVQSSSTGPRLFMMVTAVGSQAVNMPLAFDTGSAGITLYAGDIFPSTLVNSAGFVIPEGQSSITYNGITVTNQQGVRKYGYATNGRSQTGNIGYATITFGNADGQLTTQVMPVFLYYLITDNATGNPEPVPIQRGWFGVNSGPGLINVTNSTEPAGGYPVCTASTLGSCRVASVFKYFSYASGLDAGFMVNPAALQSCDITVADDCTPAPILTVGLTQAQEAGFSTSSLICPPSTYVGPLTIQDFAVCQASIPNTTITLSGPATGVFTAAPLFDTGNPAMVLLDPSSSSTPTVLPAGTMVMLSLPSGFIYNYSTTTQGMGTTTVSTTETTGIGIQFFTTNSFFIDFTSNTEGWSGS
ncbi:MAG: hypothetical protein WA642_12815 [Steroidobacteraceae bacterium]